MNLSFLTFLLMFALINSCIELEISAPSFPDIMVQLQAEASTVGLTITYNLVGFCIASLIYGPLSEYYGRRRIMLVGNGILAIGAIGCVISPQIEWLLVARFIQGLGAATSAVIVSAIIADVYAADKAAKLYGFMNAVFTTIMAMAPVIGGFINTALGWRGNYGVVAVVCIISWVLLFLFLPDTNASRPKIKIKFRKIIGDYRKLISSHLFLSAAAIPSMPYGCYMAFAALAPFIYMQDFSLSMLAYTLHQGAIIATFAITSMFSGRITELLGAKNTIWLALILSILGTTTMLWANTPYTLTATMSIFSMGSALIYPILFARSLEIFPDLKGTASSAIMSFRYLICSTITGLASYFYDGSPFMLSIVIFAVMCLILLIIVPKNMFNWVFAE